MANAHMPTPDQYLRSLGETPQEQIPPEPPRRPGRWKRVVKRTLLALLLVFLAAVIYVGYFLTQLSDKPFSLMPLERDQNGNTNILILGKGDAGHAGEKLSDTNLFVSLNRGTSKVVMISLPRDLRVPISGHGYRKLNQAHALGGPELAQETVAKVLGVPVHHDVVSDFTGLRQAVDAVGGLDVTVKERLFDAEYPCDDNPGRSCGIDLKPGQYHMDGPTILQYARCRKGTCGNDFGRAERQQEVLGLLQHKIFTSEVYTNPARLTALSAAISNNIQTDLSTNQLIQAGLLMKEPKSKQNFVLSTAPGGLLRGDPAGSSDLLPLGGDFDAIQDFVDQLINS